METLLQSSVTLINPVAVALGVKPVEEDSQVNDVKEGNGKAGEGGGGGGGVADKVDNKESKDSQDKAVAAATDDKTKVVENDKDKVHDTDKNKDKSGNNKVKEPGTKKVREKASKGDDEDIMIIQNFAKSDPFAEVTAEGVSKTETIHIRMQQRNGRKCLTTITGLVITPEERLKLLKNIKKNFSCNGHIVADPTHGDIVQLQGDHRKKLRDYLIELGPFTNENIEVHGS